jgi:hypothetical protein
MWRCSNPVDLPFDPAYPRWRNFALVDIISRTDKVETVMTLPNLLFLRRTNERTTRRAFPTVAVLAAVILAALATTLAVHAGGPASPTADIIPDAPPKPAVPPDDPAVQARPPGCAVWTDRCVTCQHEAGRILCSNIGIACQPQAVECVHSEPREEKQQKN